MVLALRETSLASPGKTDGAKSIELEAVALTVREGLPSRFRLAVTDVEAHVPVRTPGQPVIGPEGAFPPHSRSLTDDIRTYERTLAAEGFAIEDIGADRVESIDVAAAGEDGGTLDPHREGRRQHRGGSLQHGARRRRQVG